MARERLSMRKTREVLRLKYESRFTVREIARSCGIAASTVVGYLARAAVAGLGWPLPAELTDAALEARLFRRPLEELAVRPRPLPDYAAVDEELRRHRRLNLTLDLLWREYKEQHPDGYQYTQFVAHYHRWRQQRDVCLRQVHRYGEKLFVDFTDGLDLVDAPTGARTPTHLFVAVWGASNYTYAEACGSQDLPSWIGAHVRAFAYFGGLPQIVVPDNLKSGVSRACRYEPDLNPTYAEMAAHYGVAILPARPRRPRDKAKAEAGVLIAHRWILAVLRHHRLTSLAEMNTAIREPLERLNTRPLRHLKRSRRELFDAWDRPAARALPTEPYQYAVWRQATVSIDYHIAVEQHYYSVPFRLVRERVDVRLTATTLEVFAKGERVAAHVRSLRPHQHTTLAAHMPPAHQRYREWTPSRLIAWAAKTGPATAQVVEHILASRAHPEQGYRACLGLLRLGQAFSPERLEAAARRALYYRSCSFKALRTILTAGLDRLALPDADLAAEASLAPHDNLRGADYYTPDHSPGG
ncbi:MAG: IS21 family transposase [Verrucomicrobiota bacterium]